MVLPIAVASGFALAALVPFIHRPLGRAAVFVYAALPALLFALFVALAPEVVDGRPLRFEAAWVDQLRLSLTFSLDGLSLLFVLLISGIGALVIVYAEWYLHGHPEKARFHALVLAFMASMLGLVLADDLLLVLVFWGLTGVTSFLLIGFEHDIGTSRLSGQQALMVTVSGELAMLAGLVLLGYAAGTFRVSELPLLAPDLAVDPRYGLFTVLILLGALSKSAQFPFHFWLPNAMAAPTPVSAYLHSATMVTAGVYLIARLSPALGGSESWTIVLVVSGGLTMLIGAGLALRQHDLKLVLAYSTVSALGTMVLLLGIGNDYALVAAMALLLAHALYKGGLFLVTGIIDHETGTRELDRIGGLVRVMPITAVAASLGALSMAGIPATIGFAAKELGKKAALDAAEAALLIAAALVVSGAATVAVAAIAAAGPFGGRLRSPRSAHEAAVSGWLGPLALGVLGVLAGVAPFLGSGALVGSAVEAIAQRPATHAVEPWYGVDLALALTVLSIVAGLLLFWRRLDVRATVARFDIGYRIGPEKAYVVLERSMLVTARRVTELLQNGRLRRYLLVVVTTLAALVWLILIYAGGMPMIDIRGDVFIWEAIIAALIAGGAAIAVTSHSRLGAVAALGVVGYGIALMYLVFSAPDLALAQILVETLTVLLFVLAFYHMPRFGADAGRGSRLRDGAIAIAGGVLVTLFVLGATSTPADPVSDYFKAVSYDLAKGRNIVNTIIVDFRALDTLAEVTVLGIAGFGVYALLKLRGRRRDVDTESGS